MRIQNRKLVRHRKRNANPKDMYWTKVEDDLLEKYKDTGDEQYFNTLYPKLIKLCECVLHRKTWRYINKFDDENTIADMICFANKVLPHWNRKKGSGYTYLSICLVRYLIQQSNKLTKEYDGYIDSKLNKTTRVPFYDEDGTPIHEGSVMPEVYDSPFYEKIVRVINVLDSRIARPEPFPSKTRNWIKLRGIFEVYLQYIFFNKNEYQHYRHFQKGFRNEFRKLYGCKSQVTFRTIRSLLKDDKEISNIIFDRE